MQKKSFKLLPEQHEKTINLIKQLITYLYKKHKIFIFELFQNEKKWSNWKEKGCQDICKKKEEKKEINIEELNKETEEIKKNLTQQKNRILIL